MKAKFDIKNFLSENREYLISQYNKLTTERFFSGISLRDFMVDVMRKMSYYKSEKTANRFFIDVVDEVYMANRSIQGRDLRTERLERKYKGTAAMAMV